jgi:PTS system mannose-specific IIB component
MPIVLARVDHRLIHGQVIEGWVPALAADRVVVADDAAATDALRGELMRMAAPDDCTIEVMTLADAAANHAAFEDDRAHTIVLFADLRAARKAMQAGFAMTALNVGNVPATAGRHAVCEAVFLSAAEAEHVLRLRAQGIAVDFRAVPGADPGGCDETLRRVAAAAR